MTVPDAHQSIWPTGEAVARTITLVRCRESVSASPGQRWRMKTLSTCRTDGPRDPRLERRPDTSQHRPQGVLAVFCSSRSPGSTGCTKGHSVDVLSDVTEALMGARLTAWPNRRRSLGRRHWKFVAAVGCEIFCLAVHEEI